MNQIISGIILAAGESKRFGKNKLLEKTSSGSPVGLASALKMEKCVDELYVVCAASSNTKCFFSDAGYNVVTTDPDRAGMGHSLKTGILASSKSFAWVVALADMPFIPDSIYRRVAFSVREGNKLVVPYYCGIHGHPVGFNHTFLKPIKNLTDSQTGAVLIKKYEQLVIKIHTDQRGVIWDVDYPSDLL